MEVKEGPTRPSRRSIVSRAFAATLCATLSGAFVLSCSLMPRDSERLHVERISGAVLPFAQVALETGQLETAKRSYENLLRVAPDSFAARMGLGDVEQRRRNPNDAARWYLTALASASTRQERHDALLAHGRAALDAGHLEAARGSFVRLTDPQEGASNEHVAFGLNGLGLALMFDGDLRSAVALIEQAVQRAPHEEKLRGNLTRALKNLAEQVAGTSSAANAFQNRPPPRPLDGANPALSGAAERLEKAAERVEHATERLTSVTADQINGAALPAPRSRPLQGAAFAPQAPPASAPSAPGRRIDRPPAPRAPAPHTPVPGDTGTPAFPPSAPVGYLVNEPSGLFVQMGAYSTATAANAMVARLRRVTELPVQAAERGGLHRVRIGPVPAGDGLRALQNALRQAGFGRRAENKPVANEPTPAAPARPTPPPRSPAPRNAAPAPHRVSPGAVRGFSVVVGGRRFLQMGAYGNAALAEALAAQLRSTIDQPVGVATAEVGGRRLHRVRIGPVAQDDWAALVSSLATAGYGVTRSLMNQRVPTAPSRTPAARARAAPLADEPPPAADEHQPRRQEQASPPPRPAAPATRQATPAPARRPPASRTRAPPTTNATAAPRREYTETFVEPSGGGDQPTLSRQPGPGPASGRLARAFVTTDNDGVFIRIGDYNARQEAEQVGARFGARSRVPVRVVDDQAVPPRYRLRIGPVETDSEFEALLAVVDALGFDLH